MQPIVKIYATELAMVSPSLTTCDMVNDQELPTILATAYALTPIFLHYKPSKAAMDVSLFSSTLSYLAMVCSLP